MRPRPLLLFLAGTVLHLLPVLLLVVAGMWLLVSERLMLIWLGVAALCWFLGWRCWAHASARPLRAPQPGDQIGPEQFWSRLDLAVWEQVRSLAAEVESGAREINDMKAAQALAGELTDRIAATYHGESRDPRLEVGVHDLLLVVEQASRELRTGVVELIPFHHVITLNDVSRAQQTYDLAALGFNFYRLVRGITSPVSGLFGELKQILTRRSMREVSNQTSRWLLARSVEAAGKHLINLYSGNAAAFAAGAAEPAPAPALQESQLIVLLAGQVKSGKSSLANALLGAERSLVHHLPDESGVQQHQVELPGLGKVVLVDAPGYGGERSAGAVLRLLEREIARSDLLILVTEALSPARHLDAELLEGLRRHEQAHPEEHPCPVVVALLGIDGLRPIQRWNPPYDIVEPDAHDEEDDRRKAANIREAVRTAAEQLGIEEWQVVPICLRPDLEPYNVDSLLVVMEAVLPAARRRLLHRVLKDFRSEQQWAALYQSIQSGGRLLLGRGLDTFLKKARAAADALETRSKRR